MINSNLDACNKLVKLVEEIEERLKNEPIILDTEELLFQELEKTAAAVEELEGLVSQTDEFTKYLISKNLILLREKIRSLYGHVHNMAVDGEFMLLKVEALLLGKALLKGNQQNIDGQIDELKSHLIILKNNFRSSLRNQFVQDTAERFLAKVPSIGHKNPVCSDAVRVLENKLQKLWKDDLFNHDTLALIAEILEEADNRLPSQRREYLEDEIKRSFEKEPEIADVLLSMDL